jgi:hypothetical protein
MREHIGEFNAMGWEIVHVLACPGNLLECEVTMAARELTGPPGGMTGRFEVTTVSTKGGPKITLGKTVGPEAGAGFSKRTGYSYRRSTMLPKGAE